ncbi:hypothetical protein DOS62_05260, partial [Staphylococcus felis]|uniref:hypothetical protein n=1 Tax=Staphylococcus felis TaxID=46127 RepID=UPI000E39C7ED
EILKTGKTIGVTTAGNPRERKMSDDARNETMTVTSPANAHPGRREDSPIKVTCTNEATAETPDTVTVTRNQA